MTRLSWFTDRNHQARQVTQLKLTTVMQIQNKVDIVEIKMLMILFSANKIIRQQKDGQKKQYLTEWSDHKSSWQDEEDVSD